MRALLCFVLLAGSACGDDGMATDATADARVDAGDGGDPRDAVGDGGPTEVTLEEYCRRHADMYQRENLRCSGSAEDPDPVTVERDFDRCMRVASAVEAGRVDYDAAAAARCLAILEGSGCNAFPLRTRCEPVFVARVPVGSDCYISNVDGLSQVIADECASSRCVGSTCPGTCTAYTPVGDACTMGDECDPDVSACDGSACIPLPSIGDACDSSSPICPRYSRCVDGTCREPAFDGEPCVVGQCGFAAICIDGTCRRRVMPGQACASNINCPVEAPVCYDLLDGVTAAGTCETGRAGSPCQVPRECLAGHACSGSEGTPGTCVERPGAGMSCDGEGRCGPGLYCDGSTCVTKIAIGDACVYPGALVIDDETKPCAGDAYCIPTNVCALPGERVGDPCDATAAGVTCSGQLFCDSTNLCVARFAPGSACTGPFQCEEGSCEDDLCVALRGPLCVGPAT